MYTCQYYLGANSFLPEISIHFLWDSLGDTGTVKCYEAISNDILYNLDIIWLLIKIFICFIF